MNDGVGSVSIIEYEVLLLRRMVILTCRGVDDGGVGDRRGASGVGDRRGGGGGASASSSGSRYLLLIIFAPAIA